VALFEQLGRFISSYTVIGGAGVVLAVIIASFAVS
jgi:hypothetical protein